MGPAPRPSDVLLRLTSGTFGPAILVLMTVAALWLGIWHDLTGHRATVEQENWRNLAHQASLLDVNIVRTVEAIDQTLVLVRGAYVANPEAFTFGDWARARPFLNTTNLQIGITDRRGILIRSNLALPPTPVDISDRPHFHFHANNGADRLDISPPLRGRLSGRPSFQFSRRIDDRDGHFMGIVVLSLSTDFITRLYSPADIGAGYVLLAGTDGIVRAHKPGGDLVGQPLPDPALLDAALGKGESNLRLPGPRGPMLVSVRHIPEFRLLVAVALHEADTFAAYRRTRNTYLGIGGVVTVLLLFYAHVLTRNRRSRIRSELNLGLTLQNMAQGIVMVDADRRVAVINQTAIDLLGLPAALGRPGVRFGDILEWQLTTDEFADRGAGSQIGALMARSGGLDAATPVYERMRPDGTVLEIRTALLAGGRAVRTYTDITERHHAQRELAQARDAAEAASHARSSFLAVMSHEIRTPLNGIIGAAELLLGSQLGSTEHGYAAIIQHSGNHLLSLINDVLDFSRLDAGRVEMEDIVFDLPTMVRNAIDIFAVQAQEKKLSLTSDIAPSVPNFVHGDPARLRQIIFNLLGNALKFTAQGSVRVSLRATSVDAQRARIVLSVADTGIGMPPAVLDKLFTEFTQADSSVSRRFGGSGLGLAICRRLVELMGGSLRVTSTDNVGSIFTVELILRRGERPARANPAMAAGPLSLSLRVLLAEDNATNQLIATHMLHRLGHVVETVPDGRQVVRAAAEARFDVILMDVMMPEMDGLAATRAIRALPGPVRDIPIIGLTANASNTDEASCRAAGMTGFARKPITTEGLRLALAASTAPPHPAVDPAPAAPGQHPLIDHIVLTRLRAELGDAPVDEILAMFVDNADASIAALRESVASDAGAVRMQAHMIVGAAHNLGLSRLGHLAAEIEQEARIAIPSPARLEVVAEVFTQTVAAVRATPVMAPPPGTARL